MILVSLLKPKFAIELGRTVWANFGFETLAVSIPVWVESPIVTCGS
jgi:hypothetical protein